MPPLASSAIIAALFALIHIAGPRLDFLKVTPRSRWLAAAGGVSFAYVFVHLLPESAEYQEHSAEGLQPGSLWAALDRHSYLIALVGLATFYGRDPAARQSAPREAKAGRATPQRKIVLDPFGRLSRLQFPFRLPARPSERDGPARAADLWLRDSAAFGRQRSGPARAAWQSLRHARPMDLKRRLCRLASGQRLIAA